MADELMAKDQGNGFAPHPEGQFVGLCVDVVDLGERVESFPGNPQRVVAKGAIVFRTPERNEQGEAFDVSAEFTVSMNEKAGLRRFLESWRGKSYTDDQAKQGVPVHKLQGVPALLSIEHKKSAKGRTYAKIKTVSPLPKGMEAHVNLSEYTRADYWKQRREEYAAEVAKFRQASAASHDDFRDPADDDDDLPF